MIATTSNESQQFPPAVCQLKQKKIQCATRFDSYKYTRFLCSFASPRSFFRLQLSCRIVLVFYKSSSSWRLMFAFGNMYNIQQTSDVWRAPNNTQW